MASDLLEGLPTAAPARANSQLRFIDVAVTATANEFYGIYRSKQYHEPDFDSVLDRAQAAGVDKVMLTGMYLADVEVHQRLATLRPAQCFYTIGIHPYHAAERGNDSEYLTKLGDAVEEALKITASPIAAFGELGLDYDRLDRCPKDIQIKCFRAQLDLYLARGFTLPLFLHCRAAFDDFVKIMREYVPRLPSTRQKAHGNKPGLVHSFVGTSAQMHTLNSELGLDISVNGFSFKDKESLAMVRDVPLDYLQIETDAPWGLIPANSEVVKRYLVNFKPTVDFKSKKRDKWEKDCMVKERNESCEIAKVAYVVAGIKGVGVEEVCERARMNSSTMFGL